MASISSINSRLTRYIHTAEDKVGESKSKVRTLGNEWKGEAQEACENASLKLYQKMQETTSQFRQLKSKVSSLENSIEAAERDMKMKKAAKNKTK